MAQYFSHMFWAMMKSRTIVFSNVPVGAHFVLLSILVVFHIGHREVRADPAPPRKSAAPIHFQLEDQHPTKTNESLIGPVGTTVLPLTRREADKSLSATIFGFLPYWGDASHLHYDLLTHIACAAVEINPDGSIGNHHGWPWTNVINTAHTNGARVVLVAALFNSTDLVQLLTDPVAKAAFFDTIHAEMAAGGADGLNIDFEGGGTSWQPLMPAFMSELSSYLQSVQPGVEVTVDGPAVNWSNAWNLNALAASCDGVFIMGYDFYGSWSTTTGPVAPLTGGSFNINNTVRTQYASVIQTQPEKLILGVPYYGAHWTTVSSAPHSSVTGWVGAVTFANAEEAAQVHGVQWDAGSQTPWYRWQEGGVWHQVWYDNAASIGLKFDLAKAAGLKGVGMWALGYDGDRDELWEAIESRFGTQSVGPVPAVSKWGLSVTCASLLIAGAILTRRQRPQAVQSI